MFAIAQRPDGYEFESHPGPKLCGIEIRKKTYLPVILTACAAFHNIPYSSGPASRSKPWVSNYSRSVVLGMMA